MSGFLKLTAHIFFTISYVVLLPFLIIAALVGRVRGSSRVVALGPEPLINNRYHAQSLRSEGYRTETLAVNPYFITRDFDRVVAAESRLGLLVNALLCRGIWTILLNYRALFTSFNGGPMRRGWLVWRLEPWLYKLAKVRIIMLPYGGDVHDIRRCRNLELVDAFSHDYPSYFERARRIESQVMMWQRHADFVFSGCDWVDYMTYWDRIQVAHFSIDTDAIQPSELPGVQDLSRPLRVLHAPNHRAIKGTQAVIDAAEELRRDGIEVELVLLEGVPNDEVQEVIKSCDVLADQLVIGWYAMFAMEGMAHGRAVICHLEPRYLDLYRGAGLIGHDEPPLIEADTQTIKTVLRRLCEDRAEVARMGKRGRAYVERVHSLDSIGAEFAETLKGLGVEPDLVSSETGS